MKKNIFFTIAFCSLMAIVMSGCTSLHEAGYTTAEDRYRGAGSVYGEDPFYYQSARPVLVRDAFTGRLFYVQPNSGYSPYGPSLYNAPYRNRNYSNRRSYGTARTYSNRNRTQAPPKVSEEQKAQQRQRQEESRKLILGKQ